MPEHLQIVATGGMPQPRPSRPTSTTELRAQAAAEAARLDTLLERRAGQAGCYWCSSGLYSVPEIGCPACGSGTHNGHDVLAARHTQPIIETRSAIRCGMCGQPYRTGANACCIYGFKATP